MLIKYYFFKKMEQTKINNQFSSFSKFHSQKKNLENLEKNTKIFYLDKINETIKDILLKKNRTENELLIIKSYLKSLSKFIEILTKNEKKDIEYILTRISKNLKLELVKKNTFLMKIGELGNNFYIILKGKVGVLVPKHFEVIMTKKQYLNHLKMLKNFEEYYLLNSTLLENLSILSVDFQEIENTKNNIKKQEEINLKEYLSLINANEYQNEDKINSFIGLNNYEIDAILNPIKNKNPLYNKLYYLRIVGLFKVVELNKGSSFGEIALINEDSKRTASIFVIEDSIFGVLKSKDYKLSIKSSQDKIKENNISFILETKLFKDVGKNFFFNKFWNFFVERQLKKGEYVFKNNLERDELYFIYKGEVKIVIPKLTYKKINTYLKVLSHNNYYNNNNLEINKESDITLSFVKTGEIIGMNDLLYNKKFFCYGIVESKNAIIFAINFNFILNFVNSYEGVKENYNIIQNKKINIMINRLKSIKTTFENDIVEKIRRDNLLEKYDNGQKVTNFFENMGNISIPGESNAIKLKTIQSKFILNNSKTNFIKTKKTFFGNRKSIILNNNFEEGTNMRNNIINITNDSFKRDFFPKINKKSHSLSKEKTNEKTNSKNITDNFEFNTTLNSSENRLIEKKLFKTKNNKLLFQNNIIKNKYLNDFKSRNKCELYSLDSKNINSQNFLNSIAMTKNQISYLDIKEQNSQKLMKTLYFYNENVDNPLLKENLGIKIRNISYRIKNNNKSNNKKKIIPPYLYIKMGKNLHK